jgi:hypothetical protein
VAEEFYYSHYSADNAAFATAIPPTDVAASLILAGAVLNFRPDSALKVGLMRLAPR